MNQDIKIFNIELLINKKIIEQGDEIDIYTKKEIIPSVNIPILRENNSNDETFFITINNLIKILLTKGYISYNSKIYIFASYINNYILINDYNDFFCSSFLGDNKNEIKIKIIDILDKKQINNIPNLIKENSLFSSENNNIKNNIQLKTKRGRNIISKKLIKKRIKKKNYYNKRIKIKDIIERLYIWTNLYNGFYEENEKYIKSILKNESNLVKINKKTLEFYLNKIILGRRYGYDFNNMKEQNLDELTDFIKKHKKDEEDKKIRDTEYIKEK